MKKKIINGILIVAALFATSTSFVSCKDNLDPVVEAIDQVEQDMKALQSKIDEVNGKIATLESSVLKNSEDIANLKGQLATLQSELSTLQGQVSQNTADIAANKAAIDALTARVAALEENVNGLLALVNNLVVGSTVRATVDPVIGSINMPGYNPLFLAAYAGENDTEISEFPVAGDDYNVDPDGHVLRASEIKVQPVWINPGAETPGLIMGLNTNNAGTIYFTLNPIGIDASQLSFDLVNSLGTVSPVTFSNVRQSSRILTPTIGKHGNEGAEDAEADNPYLYAADAQIPLSANADLAWNKEVSSTLMLEQLNHDLSVIIARVKAANDRGLNNTVPALVEDSYNLIQNFYQSWYKNLTARQYQNLRVTYNDGNGTERIITSPENIVTAVVSPLSYNTFYMLGEVVGTPKLDKDLLQGVVGKFTKALLSKLPEQLPIKEIEIKEIQDSDLPDFKYKLIISSEDGGDLFAYLEWDDVHHGGEGFEYSKIWVFNQETGKWELLSTVDGTEFVKAIVDAVNKNIPLSEINEMIKAAQNKYTAVRTEVNSMAQRAVNYIYNKSNAIIAALGTNPYYTAVTPVVLYDTTDGIARLIPEQTIESTESHITLFLTSATEEYLVPAFKKYVAVLQGGQVISAQLLDGTDKVIDVELPMGDGEIIYSVVDFRGYTVTKKYPVTRVPNR